MTSANRSQSPVLKETVKRKAPEMILEDNKIHRIRLTSDAVCSVVKLNSANCIWFRLRNHITDQLQYIKPFMLTKLSPKKKKIEGDQGEKLDMEEPPLIEIYDYVMAPLHEGIYARARVLSLSERKERKYAFVHFIDEGFGEWMSVDCLAEMEKILQTHPWQAIPIALFKVKPGLELNKMQNLAEWPESVTNVLEKILSNYDYFRVSPIPDSRRPNNYYEYVRAEIYGLIDEDDDEGESISHRLELELNFSENQNPEQYFIDCFKKELYDGGQQPLLKPIREMPLLNLNEIPKWRLFFPSDFADGLPYKPPTPNKKKLSERKKKVDENDESMDDGESEDDIEVDMEEVRRKWDPDCNPENEYPKIPPITQEYMKENGFLSKKECMINVEWKSVKNPYDFYAFLLKKVSSTDVNNENPLNNLYQSQLKWASQLDSFYGHPTNRIPIDSDIVKRMLTNSQPVFGIYEINDEVTSGSYRRVEVIAIRNLSAADISSEFCRIRFVDVGGSDIVPLAGLLALHSRHKNIFPFCAQLCLSKIKPNPNDKDKPNDKLILENGSVGGWGDRACRKFMRLARSDVPILCEIVDQIGHTSSVHYGVEPRNWSGVLNIQNMRVIGTKTSIEKQMIDEQCAVFA